MKDKPNPLFGALADAAFPLLTIAGLLFLRSQNPGTGGIPGLGNQGKAGSCLLSLVCQTSSALCTFVHWYLFQSQRLLKGANHDFP